MFIRLRKWILLFCSGAMLWVGTSQGWSQQESPAKPASVGAQAVAVVLKHYSLNPHALEPKTQQPLPNSGNWTLGKATPASCPQTGGTCIEVFYTVPAESVRCSWVVLLNADSTDGTFLDEDDDTGRYMLRVLSKSEAAPLVIGRKNPVFPPIAVAARVSGDVFVNVVIGKTGENQAEHILSGPPMLQQASLEAAKQWTFKPLTVGTSSLPYEVKLVFKFQFLAVASAKGDLAP